MPANASRPGRSEGGYAEPFEVVSRQPSAATASQDRLQVDRCRGLSNEPFTIEPDISALDHATGGRQIEAAQEAVLCGLSTDADSGHGGLIKLQVPRRRGERYTAAPAGRVAFDEDPPGSHHQAHGTRKALLPRQSRSTKPRTVEDTISRQKILTLPSRNT